MAWSVIFPSDTFLRTHLAPESGRFQDLPGAFLGRRRRTIVGTCQVTGLRILGDRGRRPDLAVLQERRSETIRAPPMIVQCVPRPGRSASAVRRADAFGGIEHLSERRASSILGAAEGA